MWIPLLVLLASCVWSAVAAETCSLPARGNRQFPADFRFGVSTSAYQIEGAWNADGKGPSMWDDFTHKSPEFIIDHSNADVSADAYHHFDEDLRLLKGLKVQFYRFSISWARIFPNGSISSRNQAGIDYYNDVIDKLVANGIEPMVTMFHFDLPSGIQKLGGFLAPRFIDWFLAYAEELFKLYGDRVKTWVTFNDPKGYCDGYAIEAAPPQVIMPGVGDYMCKHISLIAHAATYRLYKSKYFERQRGRVGATAITDFLFSKTNDTELVDRTLEYLVGVLFNPLFSKSGGYPEVMVREIRENSRKEGRTRSRLPRLEGALKEFVHNTADFLGLNYYSSTYIRRATDPSWANPSYERDIGIAVEDDPNWIKSNTGWPFCVPEGLEGMLKYIREKYDNVEVIITENGFSDEGELVDHNRIRYLSSHLQAVLNAIHDGSHITGYSFWNLLDDFEWNYGFTQHFGLYSVNMTSPKRERTPRLSARFYRQVIESRRIPRWT